MSNWKLAKKFMHTSMEQTIKSHMKVTDKVPKMQFINDDLFNDSHFRFNSADNIPPP